MADTGSSDDDAPRQRGLARAIDDIITSYEEHGNINHLDGSNLPSRSEISQLLDDLISIVFPGFFVRDHVDDLTTRYFVGERCARVLRGLERAIGRALAIGGNGSRPELSSTDRANVAHERA